MLLRSSVARVVVPLKARCGTMEPRAFSGGSSWRSGVRRVSIRSAWSVVRDFNYGKILRKMLIYGMQASSSGNTPTTQTPTRPIADHENPYGITPEEVEEAMSYPTKWQSVLSLSEAVERRASELSERSRREAVFHEGDVLANRYFLMFKHGHKLLESQRAVDERESWNTLWKAVDINTMRQVTVEVNEAGDPGHYTAAVRSASLHALAGQHPNILRLLNVSEHRTPKGRHAVVVTERAGSNLGNIRSSFGGRTYHDLLLDRSESSSICLASRTDGILALKSIARQLFTALDLLHKRGIIHMDIHEKNILIDKRFEHRWFDPGDYVSFLKQVKELTKSVGSQSERHDTDWEHSNGSESTRLDTVQELRQALGSQSERYDTLEELRQSIDSRSARRDTYHEGDLQSATIKLTGFGRAVFNRPTAAMQADVWSVQVPCDRDGKLLKTPLQLRAPEEILGLNYPAPSYDIWRAGLTLFHLATARELFTLTRWKGYRQAMPQRLAPYGDDDLHLFDMIRVLGTLPRELIRRSPRFNELYLPSDNLKISRVLNIKPAQHDVSHLVKQMTAWKIQFQEAEALHQFITHILIPDPSKRPTAAQVLKHPWLRNNHVQRPPDDCSTSDATGVSNFF